jgi:hypothetical protein
MTLRDLLKVVAEALDRAAIPHMVVGSLASTYHGEPRATQEIDIVIDPEPEQLAEFLRSFDGEPFDVGDGRAALASRSMFNVIDGASGWKIDFIVRKDRAFSAVGMSRRIDAEVLGVPIFMATAEDTVVAKFERAAASGSERQLADAAAVIAVSGDTLDWEHLQRWVDALGLRDHLRMAIGDGPQDA